MLNLSKSHSVGMLSLNSCHCHSMSQNCVKTVQHLLKELKVFKTKNHLEHPIIHESLPAKSQQDPVEPINMPNLARQGHRTLRCFAPKQRKKLPGTSLSFPNGKTSVVGSIFQNPGGPPVTGGTSGSPSQSHAKCQRPPPRDSRRIASSKAKQKKKCYQQLVSIQSKSIEFSRIH